MTLEADRILKELTGLWVSLGEAAESGESHGVLRACAMTLIVFAEEPEAEAAARTLAELVREHPNRAVVVRLRDGGELDYQVRAQCWMPFGRREQICCEHIEIGGSAAGLSELTPVLLALAAPDLPLVLWFRSARVYGALALPARKVVVDSATFADPAAILKRLAQDSGQAIIADLAWTRLTGWREIIAQAYEDAGVRSALAALEEVRVFHGGEPVPPEAYYLAGWVLQAAGRDARARFESVPGAAGINGIALSGGGASVSVRHGAGAAVQVQTGALRYCAACPERSEAALLKEELALLGRDPIYDNALRVAARLAGHTEAH